jgi:excisionase family DNA binding protein
MATWFTVKQAAGYLQISTSTIYAMARDGTLPASRVGNQWRFDKAEIDHWLKNKSSNSREKRLK